MLENEFQRQRSPGRLEDVPPNRADHSGRLRCIDLLGGCAISRGNQMNIEDPSYFRLMTASFPKLGFHRGGKLGIHRMYYDGWHLSINLPFIYIYWGRF
jgi:hypothetical protein